KALESRDLSKVKIMWLGYPHMPTGAKANKQLFEDLVAFAKRNNILLVNDNPYSFVLNEEQLSILSIEWAKETAIELNSLSKTFNMAGWRIGMMMGSAENLNAVLKVKSNMYSGMFYGIQKGAVAALQSSPDWYKNLNRVYKKRRDLIFKLADKLNCSYD